MAVRIRWSASAVPEERKRAQWEKIIRFQVGPDGQDLDVNLTLDDGRLRWRVDSPQTAVRERIVAALRAAGKPVEWRPLSTARLNARQGVSGPRDYPADLG